jgi:hypothetical protein
MTYPTAVWDGDSPTRNRDLAQRKAPSPEDWAVITAELIATQTELDAVKAGDFDEGGVDVDEIEALADGEIIIGVDGTAANNAKVTVTGDVVIANTGAATIQEGAVEDSMIEGLAAGQIILGVDGTAANNLKAVLSGDVTMDATGEVTIAEGAVEDSMIEGLAAGQIILGVDGTAANNLKAVLSGHVTMDATGSVTIATVTKPFAKALTDLRCSAAVKDALPDSPNTTELGLADAAGSPVVGTTTNGGATASATEKCAFDFVVPEDYVAGNDLVVRVNGFVSAARNAESLLDVVAKLVKAGALDATDLCLTSPIDMKAVVAAQDNDFTVDSDAAGDELAPGDVLHVEIAFETDDTGAAADGYAQINAVSVRVPCYR